MSADVNPHCWHKAKDPRCEGFPVPVPAYRPMMSLLYGSDDDETNKTTDAAKTTVERRMTYVCCRCNTTSGGFVTGRFLWWNFKKRVGHKPPPCTGTIKVVEKIIHEDKTT